MNCLNLIADNCKLSYRLDKSVLVYMYLLSSVKVADETMVSNFSIVDVRKYFRLESDELTSVFAKLEMDGVIKIVSKDIQVGVVEGENKSLFANKIAGVNLTAEKAQVKKLYDLYSALCNKKGRRASSTECKEKLLKVIGKESEIDALSTYDFLMFFSGCYEILFHEKHRDFEKKEVGILKNLLAKYSNDVMVKMICKFIFDYSEYTKNIPNISLFAYHKDSLFIHVKGKVSHSIKREALRETTERETFHD